jgi:uncharacterized protein (DUF433 family)
MKTRYGLPVRVSEPVKTGGNVSTWKLTIETRPGQRIHLDICAVPSHDPRPMMLRNLYGIDLGTSGRIQRSPGVCGGEACVGRTRIAVWMLEEARRSGVGDLELLKDYPGLSVFDLEASWQYVEDHAQEISEAIRRNQEA